ncbi:hypothetical protein Taro_048957, partial [Colocasia esculenta]|nr:hypothetical protein [Colocasia esculenta]
MPLQSGTPAGLMVCGYETESGVCLGGGTVLIVVLWGYLVVVAFRWFVRHRVHTGMVYGAWVCRWRGGFASLELTRVCGTIEVCVVFLDTLTPEFDLYVRLRERRQRAATGVELVLCFVACSMIVVGGARHGPAVCVRLQVVVVFDGLHSYGVCLGGGTIEIVVLWGYLVVV